MALIGKIPNGNGVLTANTVVRVAIPPAYVGGSLSIQVMNFNAPSADGANDAVIETWISSNSSAPIDGDRYDLAKARADGGSVERDCAIVGNNEYIYLRSSKANVSFRISGILEENDVMQIGKLENGSGVLAPNVMTKIPVSNLFQGGTLSIHVLNFNAEDLTGGNDAKVEVWLSENSSDPSNGDRLDLEKLVSYGGTLDRECAIVGGGEFVYLRSSKGSVAYRVSGVMERKV